MSSFKNHIWSRFLKVRKFFEHLFWSWFLDERKVQKCAKLTLHCRIRWHKFPEELPLFGEDKECDEKLEEIVNNFFDPEKEEKIYKGQYAEISSWLKKDSSSDKDRKTYWRISHWVAVKTGNNDKAGKITSVYKYIAETVPVIEKRIKNLEKKTFEINERVENLEKLPKIPVIKKRIKSLKKEISEIENKIGNLEKKRCETENEIRSLEKEISEIENKIERLKKLRKILKTEERIENLKEKKSEIEKQIKNLTEPIKISEIKKAHRYFQRRFKEELEELKASYDSRTKFFSFSLKDFVQYLPLVSAFIIIGGYVHTSVLYGHFGIQTSQFFSLNDYLDSSIDKIANSFYLVGIFLVYYVAVGIEYQDQATSQMHKLLGSSKHLEYRELIQKIRLQYRKRERRFNRFVVILYFASFLLVLAIKIGKSELLSLCCFLLYTVLPYMIFLCAAWFLAGCLLNGFRHRKPEYFKSDFTDILLLSVFMFFSSMYLDAQIQIAKANQNPSTVSESVDGLPVFYQAKILCM